MAGVSPDAAPQVAEVPFELEVKSVAGECIATLTDAVPSWTAADVAARLPEVLPGHNYQLLHGQAVLEKTLGDLLPAQGGDSSVRPLLTAVVVTGPKAQEEMDLALIEAVRVLDGDKVARLLDAGASAKFVHAPEGVWGSEDSKSALHVAIEKGLSTRNQEDSAERGAWKTIAMRLLDAGADPNAKRSDIDWRGCGNRTPAFGMVLPLATVDGELMAKFLAAGADPNTKIESQTHSMRTDGHSCKYALHMAVEGGNRGAVEALLDAGANIEARNEQVYSNERGYNRDMNETALHIAAARGHADLVVLLASRGADVNAVRHDLAQEAVPVPKGQVDDPRQPGYVSPVRCIKVEERALHLAIRGGRREVVETLLTLGADATAPRVYGKTEISVDDVCGRNNDMRQVLGLPERELPPEEPKKETRARLKDKLMLYVRKLPLWGLARAPGR